MTMEGQFNPLDPLGIFRTVKRDVDRVVSSVPLPGLANPADPTVRLGEAVYLEILAGQRPEESISQTIARMISHELRVEENLLTPTEHEVLRLAAEGLSNREIADKLGIAIGTVRVHLADIRQAVGVPTREEAVAAFGKPTVRERVPISVLRALRKAEERPRVVGVERVIATLDEVGRETVEDIENRLLELGEDVKSDVMAMLRPRVVLTEKEKEGVISEFQEIMGREPTRREIDELFSEELRLKRASPGT